MNDPVLPSGKLPAALLSRLLAPFNRDADELLLPPSVGEDAGVIGIGDGALVVATDPITLTGREIGGHSVLINANDVAVLGVRPRWFLAVFLLPVGTTESEVTGMFESMREALEKLDIVLLGGHTEVTPAVVQPVVTGQMLGFQEDGLFLKTGGAEVGDAIVQIGLAPIEGAAVLAHELADKLIGVPADTLRLARDAMHDPGISVVDPALRAAALGATAMHDPTEGGLSAGLHEMAEASQVALQMDDDAVLWFAPGVAICEALQADPWGMLASGTVISAFPARVVDSALAALRAEGYKAAIIACAVPGFGVSFANGEPLPRYEQDEISRILAI